MALPEFPNMSLGDLIWKQIESESILIYKLDVWLEANNFVFMASFSYLQNKAVGLASFEF